MVRPPTRAGGPSSNVLDTTILYTRESIFLRKGAQRLPTKEPNTNAKGSNKTMNNFQQQALMSGLTFCTNQSSTQGEEEEPNWQAAPWPEMPFELDEGHASVVIDHPDKNQGLILVVLGGYSYQNPSAQFRDNRFISNNAVLLLNVEHDPTTMAWREAPQMNKDRRYFAAVVCHGALYSIGGHYSEHIDSVTDTIERIDIGDLLSSSCSNNETKKWTTLECRLSSPKEGCAAAVVHDRFIVVAGGEKSILLLIRLKGLTLETYFLHPVRTMKRRNGRLWSVACPAQKKGAPRPLYTTDSLLWRVEKMKTFSHSHQLIFWTHGHGKVHAL